MQTPISIEDQKYRQRQRLCIRLRRLHQRADRACGPVGELDTLVGAVTELVGDARRLLGDDETSALLTSSVRRTLGQAIGRLEQLKEYTAIPADICEDLDRAFQNAEDLLDSSISALSASPTPVDDVPTVGRPAWVKLVVGATGVGIVGVAGVVLAAMLNTVTINVRNVDCGDIAIPRTFVDFVAVMPGVELPDSLPEDRTVIIELPKWLARTLTVRGASELAVRGLGRELTFRPGNLDLEASNWDGIRLSSLVGGAIPVSGMHNLVLRCVP